MKKALVITVVLSLLKLYAVAQTKALPVLKLNNQKLLSILCNVDTTFLKSNDNIIVRVYQVRNKSGSAHLPESDEVSHRLVVAVSSTDDAPEQNLFEINNLLYPQIISLTNDGEQGYLLMLRHLIGSKKVEMKVRISLNNCVILKR